VLAIALLWVGAARQRNLQRAVEEGSSAPLPFALVAVFTLGGTALAFMTIVLVIALVRAERRSSPRRATARMTVDGHGAVRAHAALRRPRDGY
jgi:hypothetical protein